MVGAKIGGLELAQLLQRSEVLAQLDEESSAALAPAGVEVIDVRLNRTEIPPNAARPGSWRGGRLHRV